MAVVIYYFDKETEYSVWLSKNRETGLVVNNLKGSDIHNLTVGFPSQKDGGLRLHRATCGFLHRQIDIDNGTRTKTYGKLCGFDMQSLIRKCENKTGKQPNECWRCMGQPR